MSACPLEHEVALATEAARAINLAWREASVAYERLTALRTEAVTRMHTARRALEAARKEQP